MAPSLYLRANQTRQRSSRTRGWPALQDNASWNSGMLENAPLTRKRGAEWGSTWATCAAGWMFRGTLAD
jgi:hypothetical protein